MLMLMPPDSPVLINLIYKPRPSPFLLLLVVVAAHVYIFNLVCGIDVRRISVSLCVNVEGKDLEGV